MTEVRDRITDRITRSRVELELRRSVRPMLTFAAGLVLFALSAAFVARNLPGGGGLESTRTVGFVVADATGVVPGRAEVRFKGIPAGKITTAEYDRGRAVLTVEIKKERGPIYRDARAELRPSTPLQDMYLDVVDRGTRAAGPAQSGKPLPADQTAVGVHAADVLQVFEQPVRVRLRTLLDQFGNGLDRNGASVRTAFAQLVPLLRVAQRFSDQVVVRDRRTRRLMHNVRLLGDELAARDRDLRRLVTNGAATVNQLENSAPDLDATLRALPRTLSRIDTSFAALRGALPPVDDALRSLAPAVGALPAGLRATRALAGELRPALGALRPSVRALTPLAARLRPLAGALDRAFADLAPQAPSFDHITTSLSKCGETLSRFFHWTQSVFAMGDAHGVAPRGDAALALDSTGLTSSTHTFAAPTCSGNGTTLGGAPAEEFRP